jgi:UDP-N-acetyl-D-glucosamine dehydrogenase
VIRLVEEKGALVTYHDPFVPEVREDGHTRKGVALTAQEISAADCVVNITDHQSIDYEAVVRGARLVVDTRNATRGIQGGNVVGLSGERPRQIGHSEPSPALAGT